jgi:hypothetical protein
MAHRFKGYSHHQSGYLVEALTLPAALLLVVIVAALSSLIVHGS